MVSAADSRGQLLLVGGIARGRSDCDISARESVHDPGTDCPCRPRDEHCVHMGDTCGHPYNGTE